MFLPQALLQNVLPLDRLGLGVNTPLGCLISSRCRECRLNTIKHTREDRMLSTGTPGYSTAPFIPYGAAPLGASPTAGGGGVSPQGFDFGAFAQQIAGQAAQAL